MNPFARLARELAAWCVLWRPWLAGPFVDLPDIGTDDDGLMDSADAVKE